MSSAAIGRRAAMVHRGVLRMSAFLFLALVALGWSDRSLAQAAPTLDHEQGNGQVTTVGVPFSDTLMVYAEDATGNPDAGLEIFWTLEPGSANATFPASSFTDASGNAEIQVTPTEPGDVVILARRSDLPAVTVLFDDLEALAAPAIIFPESPNPAGGFVGVRREYRVSVYQSGLPVQNATVTWNTAPGFSADAPTSDTDVDGIAIMGITSTVPGITANAVSASVDLTPFPGDEQTYFFNANVAGVPNLTIVSGDGEQAEIGDPFPLLEIRAQTGTSNAAADLIWSVASGDATVTPVVNPTNPTSGIGSAQAVAGATDGPVEILVRWEDAGISETFNLEVRAPASIITALSDDPATIPLGGTELFRVHVEQRGLPIFGIPVTWTAAPGLTILGGASITLPSGNALVQVRGDVAGNYPDGVIATVDPDGRPGSGDESEYRFDVEVVVVSGLSINGGQNQTGVVGTELADVLSVIADDSGVPAAGEVIDWAVITGSATVNPSGVTDLNGEAHAGVTPTAPGLLRVTATRMDGAGLPVAQVTFTATIAAAPTTMTAVTPNPATIDAGQPTVFTVEVEQGGTPLVGATVSWTAVPGVTLTGGPSVTDIDGRASITVTGNNPGAFTGGVTASVNPDGLIASGDESNLAFTVNVAAAPTLTIAGGQGQAGIVGEPFPLVLSVIAENAGTPVAGVTVTWSVVIGSAVITPGSATDGTGETHASVTPTAPGPLVITAVRDDEPTVMATFNLSASAAATVVRALTANPAQLEVGVPTVFTIEAEQGGAPLAGAVVTWTAAPGIAIEKLDTTTGPDGQSSVTVTATLAGSLTNALLVEVDPDGITGSGDESSLTFSTVAATVPAMAIVSGDGQSALVGTPFALPLVVQVTDSGTPTAALPIVWTHSGDITVTPGTATDLNGEASATVVAGTNPGSATVTATRSDDPTVWVTFVLSVNQFGTLEITGGDEQVLTAGQPSDPLEVTLRDAAGVPVGGAVITWATTAGTLGSATSTTNASGVATNTVTVAVAGVVEVTASSPIAGAPAVFSLNGGLANLPGLDPIQQQVATVIDNACPALAALAAPTPAQADLLARCEELLDAAGLDPAATIDALDELMTPVALAQGHASLAAVQAQFQNLKTRIAALRSGTVGASFGGLALNTRDGPLSLGTLSAAFADEPDGHPAEAGIDFSRWGFFAAGNIGRGEYDATSREPAFDYDVEGLTVGVDYRYSDALIFGAALGYTRQDTRLDRDRGEVDTTGWSISGYTTFYRADSWYVDGVVTWGRNDFGLVRRIDYTLPTPGGGTSTISQVARSDSSGDLLSAGFTVGRDFNRGALGIGPYGRLLYTRLDFDEITEQLQPGAGSGLGLHIDERSVSSLATTLGAKMTYTHSTDWGVLIPHFQLEWEHEFKDDPQAIQARFLHDPTSTPIVVTGERADSDYFRVGLGLSMVLTRGRSGFFYYEQVFGRNGESQYNVALGLRLEF